MTNLTVPFIMALLLTSCGPAIQTRIDNPMTLLEARQHAPHFPFPASAHHIYYAEFADGMQEYECIVRFRAPLADCLAAIPKVIEFTDYGSRPASTYLSETLTGRTVLPPSMGLNPVKWFDGAVIANGVFARKVSFAGAGQCVDGPENVYGNR